MQYHLVAAAAIALAGCGSYDAMSPAPDTTAARYHDVRNALADGYRDTGIVLPNMAPDLTVLVALEYAVPIELSPAAPERFQEPLAATPPP